MTNDPPRRGVGRPVTTGKTPVRQIGRIPEEDWQRMKAAAKASGQTFTDWAWAALIRAAERPTRGPRRPPPATDRR